MNALVNEIQVKNSISIEIESKKKKYQHQMNSKSLKQRKMQTNTSKNIALPQYEFYENQQEKEFAQTYTKQSTIDKVHAFQFENDNDNRRSLVDCLLRQYDLWHPQTQTTVCESLYDNENDGRSSVDFKESSGDGGCEYENEHNINETQSSNIKLKSNIIFLELENKKLQLKQKLLQKKYQKESLEVKMAPNMEMTWRKKQKQLLEIQLKLLKQAKQLSQRLEDLKNPTRNLLIMDTSSNTCYSNFARLPKPEKQKKVNKLKLINYLLQKTEIIGSKQEFLQVLDKAQASMNIRESIRIQINSPE